MNKSEKIWLFDKYYVSKEDIGAVVIKGENESCLEYYLRFRVDNILIDTAVEGLTFKTKQEAIQWVEENL